MLAIARALMSSPRLLLLDEPSLGLAPLIVRDIFAVIRELHAQGVTILLVEQNARLALQYADRGLRAGSRADDDLRPRRRPDERRPRAAGVSRLTDWNERQGPKKCGEDALLILASLFASLAAWMISRRVLRGMADRRFTEAGEECLRHGG